MLKKEKRHDSAHKNLPGVNNSNAGILQILNRCAFGSGRDVFKKHDSANERTGKAWKRSMKATGIVRRIDDLGRVVIPKEIRRTMRIREGDPLDNSLTLEEKLAIAVHSILRRYKEQAR